MDRHAAGPRAVPGPGAGGLRSVVAAAGRRDGPAAAVRAERGARGRGDAPGRQAEQRAARQRRPGRADRLRHRHLPGRPQAHPDRHGDGLAGVHRARADPRRGRVARLRPMVTRRDPVRGGGGARPLREARRGDHHHVRDHQRGRPRGAHGGRARPGDRRAAAARARGPAGCERGRPDDHRRAAAAAGPAAGLAGRLRGHRAFGLVPSGTTPAWRGPTWVGTAWTGSASAASAGRDLAGLRCGRADDREGAAGLVCRRHGSAAGRPGVGRADRSDHAAAGSGRPAAAGQQLGAGRRRTRRGPGPHPGRRDRRPISRPGTTNRPGPERPPSRAQARPGPGPQHRPGPAPAQRTSPSPVMAPRRGRARRPSRLPARRPGPAPGTSRPGASGRGRDGRSPSRRWR